MKYSTLLYNLDILNLLTYKIYLGTLKKQQRTWKGQNCSRNDKGSTRRNNIKTAESVTLKMRKQSTPETWNNIKIVTLYKKRNRTLLNNHRPIAH